MITDCTFFIAVQCAYSAIEVVCRTQSSKTPLMCCNDFAQEEPEGVAMDVCVCVHVDAMSLGHVSVARLLLLLSPLLQVPEQSSVNCVPSEVETHTGAGQHPMEKPHESKSPASSGSVTIDVVAGPVVSVRPDLNLSCEQPLSPTSLCHCLLNSNEQSC